MEGSKYFVKEAFVKKVLVIAVIIWTIYSLKSLMNIILLTFLLTFIFYNIQKLVYNMLHRYFPVVSKKGITISIYAIICIIIGILSYKYIPIIMRQLLIINHKISKFNIRNYDGFMSINVLGNFKNIDLRGYINKSTMQLFNSLTDIGQLGLNIFLSLILSLLFNLEKYEILKFVRRFQTGKLDYFYKFISYFGMSFLNVFGKVLHAQMIISFINSILSYVWLSTLGFHQVLGLSFIIFILGLIPAAGIVISLVPFSILAFKLGGISKVINVFIMVAVLHSTESYILGPKLMPKKMNLPVFITFVVLIVAGHLMGIWGFLFGIPLFLLLLDVLGIQM